MDVLKLDSSGIAHDGRKEGEAGVVSIGLQGGKEGGREGGRVDK